MRGGFGGRGRGRGRGGFHYRDGPQLPSSLVSQLGGGGDDDGHFSVGLRRGRGGLSRKEKRKEGRVQKRKANVDYFRQRTLVNLQLKAKVAREQRQQQQLEEGKRKVEPHGKVGSRTITRGGMDVGDSTSSSRTFHDSYLSGSQRPSAPRS